MSASAYCRISLLGVAAFLITVLTLHAVQPGYDAVHQLMSELALGSYGGAMVVAFAGLALAAFGIQGALRGFDGARAVRIVLAAAATSFLAAGIFPLGATSELHIAAIATAFVLSVLALYLYPSSSPRAARAASRRLSWSLAAAIALSVVLGHSLLPMGIGQRLAALFLLAWLTIVAWNLRKSDSR